MPQIPAGIGGAVITGWGTALPPKTVTNDDLAQYLDTSDELLRARFTVSEGSHAGEAWSVQNAAAITVGTTPIVIQMTTPANPISAEVIAARGGRPSLTDAMAGNSITLPASRQAIDR